MTLKKLLSSDYKGATVDVQSQGKTVRKFFPNRLEFVSPASNAICLGNGGSRSFFPARRIVQSNSRKIVKYYNVIYGCNAIFRDIVPDFLVLTSHSVATELPADLYNITFGTAEIDRRLKGDINLIPNNLQMDAGACAAYLAAFHGAKRIFLFGYDGHPLTNENYNVYAGEKFYGSSTETVNDTEWGNNLYEVIKTYDDVEFIRMETPTYRSKSYEKLNDLSNYRTVNFRKFVSLADL